VDTLTGSVERITFYNPENGYTVLRLRPEHQTVMHAAPKSSLSFDLTNIGETKLYDRCIAFKDKGLISAYFHKAAFPQIIYSCSY